MSDILTCHQVNTQKFRYRGEPRAVSKTSPGVTWTDERTGEMRKMWAKGFSASRIAQHLGGISRNAVIGKLHRLGLLNDRKTTIRSKFTRRKADAPKPRPPQVVHSKNFRFEPPREPAAPIQQQADDIARVQLLDLEPHHCRWPVGEPTTGFCGCNKVPGLSYCASHAARAYNGKTPALGVAQHIAADEFLRKQEPVA